MEERESGGADLGAAPSKNIENGTPPLCPQEEFFGKGNNPIPNAWLVKNSRYMKREDRDPRLFLSHHYDDYLVLKSETDLIARLEAEHVLVDVFDQMGEESPKVRELVTRQIWKKNELDEKTKRLLDVSISFGVPIAKLQTSSDEETRNLYARCEELKEDIKGIKEQLSHIRTRSRNSDPKGLVALTHTELLERNIPPRQYILSPWIPEASVVMIFAPPGIGKTNLGLAIAYAVASGGKLFNWRAPEAQKAFYIDAEMHESDLQSRVKKTAAGFDSKIASPDFLRFVNGTWQPKEIGIPDLSTVEGQAIIDAQIHDSKFVVIDNLSTVCRTGNENESAAWIKMQYWLLSLKWKGITSLIVHHAGKSKDEGGIPIQRGSSMREVILDASLALKRPKGYSADQGCVFEGHFTKSRSVFGADAESFEARLEEEDGAFVWTHRKLEIRNYDLVVDLYNAGVTTPKELAEALEITRQAVEKHLKKAREKGDIS
jgi:KaiC/GvpD/RAD55 family RecA-like ATPase